MPRRGYYRRPSRGVSRRGPGAFAGTRLRGGRLGWESLISSKVYQVTDNIFTNIGPVGTVRFTPLIPQNVTRGVVTVMRIVGQMRVYFDSPDVLGDNMLDFNIQLVPVQDGNVVNNAVLDPANSADQESNRILWRRTYENEFPISGATIHKASSGNEQPCTIDIKTKRAFDRALWALVLVVDRTTTAGTDTRVNVDLRGLFKTADGI